MAIIDTLKRLLGIADKQSHDDPTAAPTVDTQQQDPTGQDPEVSGAPTLDQLAKGLGAGRGSVLAGHDVGVGVEGEGDAVVAESIGDDFGVDVGRATETVDEAATAREDDGGFEHRSGRPDQTTDWRPPLVLLSTFDNECSYCGNEILELVHRLTPTDHYGWIHYACAGELRGEDDRPRNPVAPTPYEPAEKHQCHGIMVRKKVRCEKTTVSAPLSSAGTVLDFYCKQHLNQRPDDAPAIVDPPDARARLESWDVAGESFAPGYPEDLHKLANALASTDGTPEAMAVVLRRDPENEHDENAVEVHVPMLGHRIGYLDRRAALYASESLDRGEVWEACVTAVLYNGHDTANPGVRIGGRPIKN